MSEKPILYTGVMVRATLAGIKKHTRRVIKPQPVAYGRSSYGGTRQGWIWKPKSLNRGWNDDDKDPYRNENLATTALACECPYGKRGDRLWVKETYSSHGAFGDNGRITYRADLGDSAKEPHGLKWKPSIFCPRKASRITLEIVSVRVERLQDISGEDAKAEGMDVVRNEWAGACGDFDESLTDIELYQILWESINGPGSWAANPWVWVIEFKRVEVR